MFSDFISKMEQALAQELPGEASQFLMAPAGRRAIRDIPPENYSPRKSAVLILLFPENDSIQTILIQRPEYNGVHSGQVAFPGGKFEKEDIDLRHTALRETKEEIGIDDKMVTIIGNLTDLYIPPSNFLVKPYVGYLNEKPEFLIDSYEVQRVIIADLMKFNEDGIMAEKVIIHSGGYKVKTPYYDIEGLTVWGATAMIISELNAVVKKVISL